MRIIERARTLARNLTTLASEPVQTTPQRRLTARDAMVYLLTTWMTAPGTILPEGRRVVFDEEDRMFLRAVHRFVLALGKTAPQPARTSPQTTVVEAPLVEVTTPAASAPPAPEPTQNQPPPAA